MIPGSFDYFRPVTFDELFSLQATHGMDAQLLAGGHTLLPMMKLRLATPGVLIDLAGIDSLRQVLAESDGTEVGAMTTHASVGRGVAVVLQVEGSAIRSARVAITGATESPTRLHEVEALLAGRPATEEAFKQAAQAARKLESPINDRFASSDYRCHLATVFTKRALVRALLDLDSRRK